MAWLLVRFLTADFDRRTLGQLELNHEEQNKHSGSSNCNSLEKVKKNRTDTHSSIVPLSESDGDITIRLALSCGPERPQHCHRRCLCRIDGGTITTTKRNLKVAL